MAQQIQPPAYDTDSERVLAVKLVRTLEAAYGASSAGAVLDTDSTRICLYKANKILEANL